MLNKCDCSNSSELEVTPVEEFLRIVIEKAGIAGNINNFLLCGVVTEYEKK